MIVNDDTATGPPDTIDVVFRFRSDPDVPTPDLRAYEVWTPLAAYDHARDVSAVMPRKLRALRCHASQLGHFRYDRAGRGLNRYRGAMATRTAYAEVFASPALA